MARLNIFLWMLIFCVVNIAALWILTQRPHLRQELRAILAPLTLKIANRAVQSDSLPRQPTTNVIIENDTTLWRNADFVESTSYGDLPKRSADGEPVYSIYSGEKEGTAKAQLAIIISDIGFDDQSHRWAISLPSAVTFAYSPYVTELKDNIALARGAGHEVLIDLPVAITNNLTTKIVDRGPLELDFADANSLMPRFYTVLGRATGYVGLRGDLASHVAEAPSQTKKILDELDSRGLLYLDYTNNNDTVFGDRFGRGSVKPSGFSLVDSSTIEIKQFDTNFDLVNRQAQSKNIPVVWVLPGNRALLIQLSDALSENKDNLTLLPFSHLQTN